MFKHHNIFSISAVTLIFLDCFVEIYSFASLGTVLQMGFDYNFFLAILIFVLMVSSFIGAVALVFKRNFALKLCFLLYIVQILGFIYNEAYYVLSFGLWISWSTEIGDLSIEINLVAAFISALIFMAIKSLGKVTDDK
jgi:hypothetical protein